MITALISTVRTALKTVLFVLSVKVDLHFFMETLHVFPKIKQLALKVVKNAIKMEIVLSVIKNYNLLRHMTPPIVSNAMCSSVRFVAKTTFAQSVCPLIPRTQMELVTSVMSHVPLAGMETLDVKLVSTLFLRLPLKTELVTDVKFLTAKFVLK